MAIRVAELEAKVTADTSNFDRGMSHASGTVNSLGSKVGGAAKLAGAALLGIGAAAGVGLAAATNIAMDFEQQMSAVEAVTGSTADQMADLSAQARALGKSTKFSATEVGKAQEVLGKMGITAEELLAGATEATLDLAAATGEDLTASAEAAANAMNMFGLEGDQITGVADTLTAGLNNSSASLADFNRGMAALGPVMANFNRYAGDAVGAFEDTAAAIAYFNSLGLKAADVGVSLARAFTNLADPTSEASAMMAELGISAFDLEGNMIPLPDLMDQLNRALAGATDQQREQALATIFGAEAADVMNQAIKKGGDGLREYEDRMKSSGQAAEQAAIRMNNMAGAVEEMKGGLEELALTVGEKLLPPLTRFVRWLTSDAIPAVTEFADALLSGDWSKVGDMLGDFAVNLGTVAVNIAGWVLGTLPDIQAFLTGLFTGQGGANSLGGPGERGETGTTSASGQLGVDLHNVVVNIVGWVAGNLDIPDLIAKIESAFEVSGDFVKQAGELGDRIGTGIGQAIAQGIYGAINAVFGGGGEAVPSPGLGTGGPMTLGLGDAFANLDTQLTEAIKAEVGPALDAAAEAIKTWAMEKAAEIGRSLLEGLVEGLQSPDMIGLPGIANQLRDALGSLLEGSLIPLEAKAAGGEAGAVAESTIGTDLVNAAVASVTNADWTPVNEAIAAKLAESLNAGLMGATSGKATGPVIQEIGGNIVNLISVSVDTADWAIVEESIQTKLGETLSNALLSVTFGGGDTGGGKSGAGGAMGVGASLVGQINTSLAGADWSAIGTTIQTSLTTQITTAMTTIQTAWTTAWTAITTATTTAVQSITTAIQTGATEWQTAVANAGTEISSAMTTAMAGVVSAVSLGMAQAVAAVTTGVANIITAMSGAAHSAFALGEAVGAGFAAGISSQIGAVNAAAASLAEAAASALASAAEVASPSKVTFRLGSDWGEGFWLGMLSQEVQTMAAARWLAQRAVAAADDALSRSLARLRGTATILAAARTALAGIDREAYPDRYQNVSQKVNQLSRQRAQQQAAAVAAREQDLRDRIRDAERDARHADDRGAERVAEARVRSLRAQLALMDDLAAAVDRVANANSLAAEEIARMKLEEVKAKLDEIRARGRAMGDALGGAAEKAAEATDKAAGKMKEDFGQVADAGKAAGTSIADSFAGAVQSAQSAIESLGLDINKTMADLMNTELVMTVDADTSPLDQMISAMQGDTVGTVFVDVKGKGNPAGDVGAGGPGHVPGSGGRDAPAGDGGGGGGSGSGNGGGGGGHGGGGGDEQCYHDGQCPEGKVCLNGVCKRDRGRSGVRSGRTTPAGQGTTNVYVSMEGATFYNAEEFIETMAAMSRQTSVTASRGV